MSPGVPLPLWDPWPGRCPEPHFPFALVEMELGLGRPPAVERRMGMRPGLSRCPGSPQPTHLTTCEAPVWPGRVAGPQGPHGAGGK